MLPPGGCGFDSRRARTFAAGANCGTDGGERNAERVVDREPEAGKAEFGEQAAGKSRTLGASTIQRSETQVANASRE
jgi:hypothetical protein